MRYSLKDQRCQADLAQVFAEKMNIADIAATLATVNHYHGHSPMFFSVAQHSLAVATCLEKLGASASLVLAGLLNQAHIAYLATVAVQVKRAIGPAMDKVEERLHREVLSELGVPCADYSHPLVRQAAMIVRNQLASAVDQASGIGDTPNSIPQPCAAAMPILVKESPDVVREQFLARYSALAEMARGISIRPKPSAAILRVARAVNRAAARRIA